MIEITYTDDNVEDNDEQNYYADKELNFFMPRWHKFINS
jgi:hypothetical protein